MLRGNPPVEKVHEYEIKGRYGQPHFCHEALKLGTSSCFAFREEKTLIGTMDDQRSGGPGFSTLKA